MAHLARQQGGRSGHSRSGRPPVQCDRSIRVILHSLLLMARFAVILPAAGKSSRFHLQKRKKTFVELRGRAVWLRAAEHFVNRDDVVQTLVVVSPDDLGWFKEK